MTPLSAPIPLRSSTEWHTFRDAVPIPQRYGNTGGALIQYNEERTQFVWAGHACIAVDDVLAGGLSVSGWEFGNTTDSAGQPVAMVEFAQPQDEGVELVARGRGKPHPTTGQLMTNPADVVLDVLANLAGRNVAAADLATFRRECEQMELEVGGSIESADSVQSIVRSIVESVGAIYCADMPGIARVWPGGAAGAPLLRIVDGKATASCNLDDLANDLTIRYAYESAGPRASVQLDAPDLIAVHGRHADTMEVKWITSSRVAVSVGTRILQQRARPVYAIEVPSARTLQVGNTVTIAHPGLPVSGAHLILSRSVDLDNDTCSIGLRIPCGDIPAVRLVRQSAASESQQYTSATVVTQGSERVLTLLDDRPGNPPIVAAQVTLDGGTQIRFTDAAGRVSFPVSSMPPGPHRLDVLTADGRSLIFEITIQ